MFLETLDVSGYRSLRSVTLDFSRLTSLIGANGSGKSSALGALRMFFDPLAQVGPEDFWRSESVGVGADQISIITRWSQLSKEALTAFGDFVSADGALAVERRFESPGRGEYLASRLAVPEFTNLRRMVRDHRSTYEGLRNTEAFADLPAVRNRQEVFAALSAWEVSHPDRCTSGTETFPEVDRLRDFVSFLYIGAFENPASHLGASGTGALGQLVGSVVDRSEIDRQLKEIADDATLRSAKVLAQEADSLTAVGHAMADRIHSFAPGSNVRLAWDIEVSIRGIQPNLLISIEAQDGLPRPLEYQGHGVQRSLMYAALTTAADVRGLAGRSTILVIEEPEAFQHPLSAKVLARSLQTLSEGVHQIAYSTHSPDFVRAESADGLRIIRRQDVGAGQETLIQGLSDSVLLERWTEVFGENVEFSIESMRARLGAHLTKPVLAGLFARICVLVEGDEDEALIRGISSQCSIDLDGLGIAVIPTNGKTGMPNVLTFLRAAGVSCYVVFDMDRDKTRLDEQHRASEGQLKKGLGLTDVEFVSGVYDSFACWNENLTTTVAGELGESYQRLIEASAAKFGYTPKRAKKVPVVIADFLERASEEDLTSPSLTDLCRRIVALLPA